MRCYSQKVLKIREHGIRIEKIEKKHGDDKCIPISVLEPLKYFLLGREFDIAIDFEDLGSLKEIFKLVIGREPAEEKLKSRITRKDG